MIISLDNIKNPYLMAYVKKFNIKDGDIVKTTNYMFWIDQKHDNFRRMHNLPEHIVLNEKQQQKFIEFLNQ